MSRVKFFFSLIWKTIIICTGGFAVLDSLGLFGTPGAEYFWNYFTDVSNTFIILYFIAETILLIARRHQICSPACAPKHLIAGQNGSGASHASYIPPLPLLKQTLIMGVLLTLVISTLFLGSKPTGNLNIDADLLILHYVVPIMSVLDWLLFDRKGIMQPWAPLVWSLFPLAYLAWLEICVNVFGIYMGGVYANYGMYPYPFLWVESIGKTKVLMYCGGFYLGTLALGYILCAIDTILGKREAQDLQ